MALKKSQKSLKQWGKEKWRTKSGKPSGETGERYMPEKAIEKLTPSQYAATTAKKRAATKAGKQSAKNTKAAAKAVKSSRMGSTKKSTAKKSTAKKSTTRKTAKKSTTRKRKY